MTRDVCVTKKYLNNLVLCCYNGWRPKPLDQEVGNRKRLLKARSSIGTILCKYCKYEKRIRFDRQQFSRNNNYNNRTWEVVPSGIEFTIAVMLSCRWYKIRTMAPGQSKWYSIISIYFVPLPLSYSVRKSWRSDILLTPLDLWTSIATTTPPKRRERATTTNTTTNTTTTATTALLY